MRAGVNKIRHNLVYVMPEFIHEFGDSAHHMSMMRTVDYDEEEGYIPGTGPPNWRFEVHEVLDYYIFYPISHWISDVVGDNDVGQLLRNLLGFFWGLNCGFPARDVVLYTAWTLRGCKPRAVFRKFADEWIKTYPDETKNARYRTLYRLDDERDSRGDSELDETKSLKNKAKTC